MSNNIQQKLIHKTLIPTFTQGFKTGEAGLIHKKPVKMLLNVENASMRFGQRILWQKVNFGIQTGEFVALLGANGAGKTTLLQSVLQILPLSSGHVKITQGVKIGYVPQLKNFDPKLPIRGRDLVRLGLEGGNFFFGFINCKKQFGRYWLSNQHKNYLVDKAIDEVNGKAFADAPLNMLSGGEQQRMRIAQALVADPDLLLMDEPLLSLDMASQQIVCDILAHRRRSHQTAVLMISHELLPIIPLVDKVVYLAEQSAKIGGVELMNLSPVSFYS